MLPSQDNAGWQGSTQSFRDPGLFPCRAGFLSLGLLTPWTPVILCCRRMSCALRDTRQHPWLLSTRRQKDTHTPSYDSVPWVKTAHLGALPSFRVWSVPLDPSRPPSRGGKGKHTKGQDRRGCIFSHSVGQGQLHEYNRLGKVA